RAIAGVWSGIGLLGVINLTDDGLPAARRVGQFPQLCGNFGAQGSCRSIGRDDSLALAPGLIDVDSGQPECIRAGSGPIDTSQVVATVGIGFDCQVAFVTEPGIQMHTSREITEAVV